MLVEIDDTQEIGIGARLVAGPDEQVLFVVGMIRSDGAHGSGDQ
jgi:hypothetical protein